MIHFRLKFIVLFSCVISGCQLGYLMKSSVSQLQLLNQRQDIHAVIASHPDQEVRRKLQLSLKVREFCEKKLHLSLNKNYLTYVQLDRPYVTYVVSAAEKFEFKPYRWWFPIVGHVPYKGFFNKRDAESEAIELKNKNLDVYLRGVSAYSTLGWFDDPLLSSMIHDDIDLINTIIHENIHANVYIKGESELNENIASFFGDWGTEIYLADPDFGEKKELERFKNEMSDEIKFKTFILNEIREYEKWLMASARNEQERQAYFTQMKNRFRANVLPTMTSSRYSSFEKREINNAYLYQFTLYSGQEDTLQLVSKRYRHNFNDMLNALKRIKEKSDFTRLLEQP